MKYLILGFLPFISFVAGCGGSGTAGADRTKAAILRALNADKEIGKRMNILPPKSTPSQVSWAIGECCNAMERLEMSDCPADFRVAYRHHAGAWREVQKACAQLPDGFLEGLFLGTVNTFLRGERDGGVARLEGGLQKAIERVRDTWIEVEKIGAKYDADLGNK